VLFVGRTTDHAKGRSGADAGGRGTVENRGVVCNGHSDRTEGFCGVKRSGSSEQEQFVLKRLRSCETA